MSVLSYVRMIGTPHSTTDLLQHATFEIDDIVATFGLLLRRFIAHPDTTNLCATTIIAFFFPLKATGMEGTSTTDDLLDLGVDSAMAVGISADLSEACGRDLPSELVFTHPTPSLIAEFIASLRKNEEEHESNNGYVGADLSVRFARYFEVVCLAAAFHSPVIAVQILASKNV